MVPSYTDISFFGLSTIQGSFLILNLGVKKSLESVGWLLSSATLQKMSVFSTF